MTRINCVPVRELSREHLIAEYRELPRIFKLAYKAMERGENPKDMPDTYRMGEGHVRFFYSRLAWVSARFEELVAEMIRRKYKVSYMAPPEISKQIPHTWYGFWSPTEQDREINRQRIQERTKPNSDYDFWGP